jgi:hypothetical protein
MGARPGLFLVREPALPRGRERLREWAGRVEHEKGTFYDFMRDTSERRVLRRSWRRRRLESIGHLAAGVLRNQHTHSIRGRQTRFLEESFRNLDRVLTSYGTLVEAVSAGILTKRCSERQAARKQTPYLRDKFREPSGNPAKAWARGHHRKAMKGFAHQVRRK